MHGPTLPYSERLHAEKYRGRGESFREAMGRIASALADGDEHFATLRDMLLDMRFLPAGRIQASVGSTRGTTPFNCYVSGPIADSFVDDPGSIMQRASEAAATMRLGGGIGYDFSTLRPRGALIKKLESYSSGPISFMEIYDAVCRCIASSGHRRGAQMGVLRVDHPDIEDFIHAKQNNHRLTGFNISIAVTDEFMQAVERRAPFDLRFGGQVYRTVDSRALWESIMRSTWDWAEPGVLFIDQINRMNNLWYCEEIAATNPCGEQPLPPFGACLLGSFNLVKYLNPFAQGFDLHRLRHDVHAAVRAMDTVIDLALYPLPEQAHEARSKRRMGLGVTGLANALEAMGHFYGSQQFLVEEATILAALRNFAYEASIELAKDRGPFPLFDERYLAGDFIQTLPETIQAAIAEHGIRNSHLLSIAPTGTISLCADNVSSGIEPVFAYEMERAIREEGGDRLEVVTDYGWRELGVMGRQACDVSVDEHLDVLAVASAYVDSSVSKTCNVPSDTSWEDFQGLYMEAWRRGCKGLTTYQVGGKRGAILRATENAACRLDPETGRRECE